MRCILIDWDGNPATWGGCNFRRYGEAGSPGIPERCCHPLEDVKGVAVPTINIGGVECRFCKKHYNQVKKSETGYPRFGLFTDGFLPSHHADKPEGMGGSINWKEDLDGNPIEKKKGGRGPNKKKVKKLVSLDDKDRRIAELEGQVDELKSILNDLQAENDLLKADAYSEAGSEATQSFDGDTDEETEELKTEWTSPKGGSVDIPGGVGWVEGEEKQLELLLPYLKEAWRLGLSEASCGRPLTAEDACRLGLTYTEQKRRMKRFFRGWKEAKK